MYVCVYVCMCVCKCMYVYGWMDEIDVVAGLRAHCVPWLVLEMQV